MIKAVIFDMFETLITHYNSPIYFSKEIADDAGIPENDFRALWRPTDADRTTGALTFEDTITMILNQFKVYSDDKLNFITRKRINTKKECFANLHPEILPMLEALREKGVLIGLISNCYSEEAIVIRSSVLFPYFDAVCLSYEEKIKKPDEEIFKRCIDRLSVNPNECIYIGDGESNELETASHLGMNAFQATWYLKNEIEQQSKISKDFSQIEAPLDILKIL